MITTRTAANARQTGNTTLMTGAETLCAANTAIVICNQWNIERCIVNELRGWSNGNFTLNYGICEDVCDAVLRILAASIFTDECGIMELRSNWHTTIKVSGGNGMLPSILRQCSTKREWRICDRDRWNETRWRRCVIGTLRQTTTNKKPHSQSEFSFFLSVLPVVLMWTLFSVLFKRFANDLQYCGEMLWQDSRQSELESTAMSLYG